MPKMTKEELRAWAKEKVAQMPKLTEAQARLIAEVLDERGARSA